MPRSVNRTTRVVRLKSVTPSHVATNFLTNILNNVAETEIDFPVVRVADAA